MVDSEGYDDIGFEIYIYDVWFRIVYLLFKNSKDIIIIKWLIKQFM